MKRSQQYEDHELHHHRPRTSHRHAGRHHEEPVPNISGTWRLDKARSDPIAPYLRAMGLCQIAIDGHHQKEASTETYYTFEQSATALTTSKASWSGASRRELHFGETRVRLFAGVRPQKTTWCCSPRAG